MFLHSEEIMLHLPVMMVQLLVALMELVLVFNNVARRHVRESEGLYAHSHAFSLHHHLFKRARRHFDGLSIGMNGTGGQVLNREFLAQRYLDVGILLAAVAKDLDA